MSVWRQNRWRRGRRPSRLRRIGDMGLALAILLLLALSVARFDQIATRQLAGEVRINDGDSVTLAGERIRLRGIDAPEFDQKCTIDGRPYDCGASARRKLSELASRGTVTCRGWERDRYDRLLARCEAGGSDLGRAMVESGWAVSYGGYADAEAEARRSKKGLWAGSFDAPKDWRAHRQEPDEGPHDWLAQAVSFLRQFFGIFDAS